ncbi:MAG: 4-deoxy-4-formamido-L-arabinose-phosphoundecaprenol deformylase [Proteobacteria bacterium]|nr:4-deoxy-4-formamido-L-arabinose-phosphoundecaprenol deformylase [Pseudomonadota bacterium]
MSESKLAIKVDVDTWLGTRDGVPRIRHLLDVRGVPASFYLSLGPDRSGRAVWRIFHRRGFLAKMLRTRAPGAYGLRTLLYGTVLPAPLIGRGRELMVRRLMRAGHEAGLHAWDHVDWHDRLWRMNPAEVRAEVDRGVEAFSCLAGDPPSGFAAPAWRISAPAAQALKASGLTYMSATRGRGPYWPVIEGQAVGLLEIPTTLPTADEVLGREGLTPDNLDDFFLERILDPGLHVLTVHAEMEGRALAPAFARLLDGCLKHGVTFVRLIDLAGECLKNPSALPLSEVVALDVPGRAGRVSHQKT